MVASDLAHVHSEPYAFAIDMRFCRICANFTTARSQIRETYYFVEVETITGFVSGCFRLYRLVSLSIFAFV